MAYRKKGKVPKLSNALNQVELGKFLDNLTEEEISKIKYSLSELIYWWMGNPSETRIKLLFSKFPFLYKFLNSEIVIKRLQILDKFESHYLGISISDFLPELVKIRDEFYLRYNDIPKDIKKAELWLLPIALDAGADVNLEAAIYFASRGKGHIIDSNCIKDKWHKSICQSIERGRPLANRLTEDIKKRANEQLISLTEAAALLTFHDSIPQFFSFRDEEEDFITACFFRGVEWFNIKGFEQWINSFAAELSTVGQSGIDHIRTSWHLFFWCRSDLALRKVNKFGLESIIWALMNGNIERNSPWKQTSWTSKDFLIVDYIPIASILVFAWYRIKPSNIDSSTIDRAIELIFATQMPSGAWTIKSDDTEGSIISTCFAIHALAIAKPNGWLNACKLAKTWLYEQQDETGCWHVDGGPTVMLTVLVLDSINLADESSIVTFYFKPQIPTIKIPEETIEEPVYDYTSEPWFNTLSPEILSIAKTEIQKTFSPKISLVVATEVELKQTLARLKPIKNKRKILRVVFKHDTYYLGKFGAFDTVVVMSSMGTEGTTGSALTIETLIQTWNPKAIILVGIAFGANRTKYLPADVLIAENIIPYENQRIGERIIFRNAIPPSSSILLNRFKNAFDWKFLRPDKTPVSKHFGPVLSGSKLVDNIDFKNHLLDEYPNAIGGEMEGSGLCSAAARHNKEWIVIKSVCDWGDGKKNKNFQQMAAASSISLCENVFTDPHALDGL